VSFGDDSGSGVGGAVPVLGVADESWPSGGSSKEVASTMESSGSMWWSRIVSFSKESCSGIEVASVSCSIEEVAGKSDVSVTGRGEFSSVVSEGLDGVFLSSAQLSSRSHSSASSRWLVISRWDIGGVLSLSGVIVTGKWLLKSAYAVGISEKTVV